MILSRGRPLPSLKAPRLDTHRSLVSDSRRPTSITILAAVALQAAREVTLLAAPVAIIQGILRTTVEAPQVAEVGHLTAHPVDLVVVVEAADPPEGRPRNCRPNSMQKEYMRACTK